MKSEQTGNMKSIKEIIFMKIINDTTHRPFPLPRGNWIMKQAWRDLLFIHWPISPDQLKKHIPPSLQIDTFNRTAWVGIVAFVMAGIYPRGLSSLSILPAFPEINVRTYVQYEGKPGVYFMSLDVDDWASLTIAKRWLHLPYQPAKICIHKKENAFHCSSTRQKSNHPIIYEGMHTPNSEIFFPIEGTLDHWLTERYCFFSSNKRENLFCCEIHHSPWPLQHAKTVVKKNTLFSPFHIDVNGIQPIAHFSKGVDSLIWNIKSV